MLAGGFEKLAGVVLESREVRSRQDGCDVALGVGWVDDDERVIERAGTVVFGVESDGWMPVGRRFEE